MRKMVNAKAWRRAATESIFGEDPLNVSTWDNTHLEPIYTKLWTCTTWLLAKELCLGTMNMGRTVEMTKIFSTFVSTYVYYKTHPDKETLKKWSEYRQKALDIPHMERVTSKSAKTIPEVNSTLGVVPNGPKGLGSQLRDW